MTPAVLSALLLFLAFLDLPTRFLAGVALVPWLIQLHRETGPRAAARTGALLFGVFWTLHLGWMGVLVLRLGVTWPLTAWMGEVLLLALLGAATGAAAWGLRSRLPLPLAGAVAWVGVEWARGHLLGPLRFPWSPLALPLTEWLPLVQPAAWVGEAGVGLLLLLVNGGVAVAVLRLGEAPGRVWVPLGLTTLLVVAWWGSGAARLVRVETLPVVTAGAVQPGTPLEVKRDSLAAPVAARESLVRLLPELVEQGAEVVVLPETHFPAVFPDTALAGWLAGWADTLEAELLLGAYARNARGGVENAVLRVTPAGVEGRYGKVGLVPGVEWVPGSGLARGGPPVPLEAPGAPGALICIESGWSGVARGHLRGGAGWLVNVTNDGWLAGREPWTRTPAFRQHPRHLVLRSVETGLGALRVGTTGLTGVVDPEGRWRPLLPPHEAGVAVTRVERLEGVTLLVRTGDWLGPATLLTALLGLGLAGWGKGRRGRPLDRGDPR